MNGAALYMLFNSTTESILSLRTPLSTFLEEGLIVLKLESAGAEGRAILDHLDDVSTSARAMHDAQIDILVRLTKIFLGGEQPVATMEEVRATGLYPGDSPKDFDIHDHL